MIYFWIKQPLDSKFGVFGWTIFSICLLLSTLSSTLGEILISLDDIWSQIKIVFLSAAVVLSGIYFSHSAISIVWNLYRNYYLYNISNLLVVKSNTIYRIERSRLKYVRTHISKAHNASMGKMHLLKGAMLSPLYWMASHHYSVPGLYLHYQAFVLDCGYFFPNMSRNITYNMIFPY
jgi:hypothetical protein